MASTAAQPVVLVTNDDGIDAPGLRFLVDQLVAQGRYRVLVSAPDTSALSPSPLPLVIPSSLAPIRSVSRLLVALPKFCGGNA
jgi:broad specificity polyphosphatase/5'/3'-nucleotidase SurE